MPSAPPSKKNLVPDPIRFFKHALIIDELIAGRILLLGAGSAAIGIANLIVSAMQQQGLAKDAAEAKITLFDVDGPLEPSRTDLSPDQKV